MTGLAMTEFEGEARPDQARLGYMMSINRYRLGRTISSRSFSLMFVVFFFLVSGTQREWPTARLRPH